MNRVNYNPNIEPWYAPKKIIQAAQLFGQTYGNYFLFKSDFKRAREIFIAAIAAIGAYRLDPENKYFIQLNNQSDTPDVMSGVLIKEQNDKEITLVHTPIEIVELEEHSSDTDLFEFIKRKKLFPVKKYENTLILCFINKDFILPDPTELKAKFEAENPESCSIFYLGRSSKTNINMFKIMTPYPQASPWVEYDVVKTAYSYEMPDSVMMQKGYKEEITMINERKVPFKIYEAMGVDETKVAKYKKHPIN